MSPQDMANIGSGNVAFKKMLKISVFDMSLKINTLRLQLHLPGTKELIVYILFHSK